MSCAQKMADKFIEEFADRIDWTILPDVQTLSLDIVEKFKDRMDWDTISSKQPLSTKFIIENIENINFRYLSNNNLITEETRLLFWDKLDIYLASSPPMSEKNIAMLQENVNWDVISCNQTL